MSITGQQLTVLLIYGLVSVGCGPSTETQDQIPEDWFVGDWFARNCSGNDLVTQCEVESIDTLTASQAGTAESSVMADSECLLTSYVNPTAQWRLLNDRTVELSFPDDQGEIRLAGSFIESLEVTWLSDCRAVSVNDRGGEVEWIRGTPEFSKSPLFDCAFRLQTPRGCAAARDDE